MLGKEVALQRQRQKGNDWEMDGGGRFERDHKSNSEGDS